MNTLPTTELAQLRDDFELLLDGKTTQNKDLDLSQQLCIPAITSAIKEKAFVIIQTQNVQQQFISISVKAIRLLDRILENDPKSDIESICNNSLDNNLTLAEFKHKAEAAYIAAAMKKTGSNNTKTAKLLNCNRSNLSRKIKHYEL